MFGINGVSIRGDNSKFLKIIGNCNFKFGETRRGNILVSIIRDVIKRGRIIGKLINLKFKAQYVCLKCLEKFDLIHCQYLYIVKRLI